MARTKATIDPSDVRHPSAELELAMQGKRQEPGRQQLLYIHQRYWDLKETMDRLMSRTDGWLRIVPHPDDDRIYLKWKYVSGRHQGCYVMSVVRTNQLPEGLMLLMHKVHQADEGLLHPTKDKLHGED